MASAGRKDKNFPDTPESSTTESSTKSSSGPSVDDEEAPLQRRSAGESSSGRQSRSRVKMRKESSDSSTPKSSVPSVDNVEAQLFPCSAQASGTASSREKTAPSESPTTQSSAISIDDAHLLPSSSRASSIKSSRGKPVPSESSTPQSSVPSVDNEEAHLLSYRARTSTSKSPKKPKEARNTAADRRSHFASSCPPSARNAPKPSPEKSSLAVPESRSSGGSPRSPSKSPSGLIRMIKSIKDTFTSPKSPKERSKSSSHRKTYPEFGSPKRSHETKTSENASETISRENFENVRSSSSSNSGGRVLSDDASRSETRMMEVSRLNVPQPKKAEGSPKRGIFGKLRSLTLHDCKKVEKSTSDTSPKASSKSTTPSSSVSPVSRKRQESDTSNISWENTRSSNSKSSSTSCANYEEYLRPDAAQFPRCSPNRNRSDSQAGSSSDSAGCSHRLRPGSEEFAREMLYGHVHDPCPSEAQEHCFENEPVTENLDDLHLDDEQRRRSRSYFSRFILKHIKRGSTSKNDDGVQNRAACADPPVGTSSDNRGVIPKKKWQHASGSSSTKRAVRPNQLNTRHESMSPECKHKKGYILSPGCTKVRQARDRRSRRRCRENVANVNDAVIDVSHRTLRIREKFSNLYTSQGALSLLRLGAETAEACLRKILQNYQNADGEFQLQLSSLGGEFEKLRRDIDAFMADPIFLRLQEIAMRVFDRNSDVAVVLGNINPDYLSRCRVGERMLRAAEREMEGFEEELEEIRISINSRLGDVRTGLMTIRERMVPFQRNTNMPLLEETLRLLTLMERDMAKINERLHCERN